MPSDFTSKRPRRPELTPETETREMEDYIRSLNLDGMSLLPGKSEPEPMVGVDQKSLKDRLEKNREMKERLLRDMAATWQCTRCKRQIEGKNIRVRVIGGLWQSVNGVRTLVGGEEVLVCQDQACNGPVVKLKDPYRSKLI